MINHEPARYHLRDGEYILRAASVHRMTAELLKRINETTRPLERDK